MVRAQGRLLVGQGLAQQVLGGAVPALRGQGHGEGLAAARDIGVAGAQAGLADGQGAPVQALGGGGLAEVLQDGTEVVEQGGVQPVARGQHGLDGGEGGAQQGLCVPPATLVGTQQRQVARGIGGAAMAVAPSLAEQRMGAAQAIPGLVVAAQGSQRRTQVDQALRDLRGRMRRRCPFAQRQRQPVQARRAGRPGLRLGDQDRFEFAWIVDFPMYEKNPDTGAVEFSHNPFSMPQGGMEALMGDPLKVHAYQYDLACNGYELISGGIRNHKPDIMFKAFELAGYPASEVEKRFGGMVKAFKYGAPPHGGCAAGIDRIVMLLADTANIREVIMFPMNQRAEDLMMNAPSDPTNEQLRELRLRVVPKD